MYYVKYCCGQLMKLMHLEGQGEKEEMRNIQEMRSILGMNE